MKRRPPYRTRSTAALRSATLATRCDGVKPREPVEAQIGDVGRAPTVQQQRGHHLPDRGRMLETVAAEADGEEEPVDPRSPVEDRASVRGERTEAGPSVAHLRAIQCRDAAHRL